MSEAQIWVEKYRPQTFEELVIPSDLRKYLEKLKETGEIPIMTLYGPAGTGKTSTAEVIAKELGSNMLYVNGSVETGKSTVEDKVSKFAERRGVFDTAKKIVLIDEFERLTPNAQDALKGVSERSAKVTGFIFTTNNIHKVIDPIRSRGNEFDFGSKESSRKDLILQFFSRVKTILEKENVEYDIESVLTIIKNKFPDFRRTLNTLQKYSFIHGKIDKDAISFSNDMASTNELIEAMKKMDYKEIRRLVTEIDPDYFYTFFYDQVDTLLKIDSRVPTIILLANYIHQHTLSVNKTITLAGCVLSIAEKVKWK